MTMTVNIKPPKKSAFQIETAPDFFQITYTGDSVRYPWNGQNYCDSEFGERGLQQDVL